MLDCLFHSSENDQQVWSINFAFIANELSAQNNSKHWARERPSNRARSTKRKTKTITLIRVRQASIALLDFVAWLKHSSSSFNRSIHELNDGQPQQLILFRMIRTRSVDVLAIAAISWEYMPIKQCIGWLILQFFFHKENISGQMISFIDENTKKYHRELHWFRFNASLKYSFIVHDEWKARIAYQ